MNASLYASQWFLTLMCSDLRMEIALKVIDYFLLDGWKVLFGVMLALLKMSESKLPCERREDHSHGF